MTIHKVQSATIKQLYVDMDRGSFAPGMLYVALSRAVSLDGLILSKPIEYDDVIVDEKVIEFYNSYM
jgi:ATP-dependent exoDNAse (exonuclease V) alpha subunit